jgi:hypothetical protein
LVQTFFPNNPNAQIDPVVLKLLNAKGNQFCSGANGFLIPSIAGTPGQSGSFTCSNPGKFTDDQFTTNWDRNFNDSREKIAARFFFSNADSLKPFGAGGLTTTFGAPPSKTDLNFPLDVPVHTRFLSTSWTHTFSNEKVNQLTFGYVRINNSYTNVPIITAADLGINRPMNAITKAIYKFTFNTSGFQIGPSDGDQFQVQNNFVYSDVFSWVHGKHELRFGGEFDRINLHKLFPQIFNGQLFFTNTGTTAAPPVFTDFQNFLQGAVQFSFGQSGVYNHDYHHRNFSFFAQDDWKVTHNLTLNIGLRVESFGAWRDDLCHIGNFDASLLLKGGSPYIYPGCVNRFGISGLSGTANSTTLRNSYATGLGPRLGVAYDLFGRHTTTLRGGYGIYFVQQDVGNVDQLSFAAPFLNSVFSPGPAGCMASFFEPVMPAGCQNPNPNGLPLVNTISPAFVPVISQLTGFVTASGNPTTDTSQIPVYNNNSINLFALQVPQHFVAPNVQQWNLTLQRALWKGWILETGYVGSHTVHLRETHNMLQSILVSPRNPLTVSGANGQQFVITTNTIANAVARSLYQGINGYSGFEVFADDAYAHYHALQTTLSRHSGNSYFQAAYTFSRSTDATSSFNTAFNTAFNDQLILSGSRGLSDFDRPHRLVASYFYALPLFAHETGWKKQLLRGWGISGISVFQSGPPFSIMDSNAGSAYAALTTIPTTASLAPGATIALGYSSGSIGSRINAYLNIAAFKPAPVIGDDGAATGFGTLGRNTYRGPFEQNWDLSINKNFSLTERQKMRFTVDLFDLWNHPVFSAPAFTDVQNPAAFGQIISTENNPRIIQFSLKWSF